jgi:tricorn protease-like protein
MVSPTLRRRGRDLNPRRTFQHVRDFQSRSLGHSDTSPRERRVSVDFRPGKRPRLARGGEFISPGALSSACRPEGKESGTPSGQRAEFVLCSYSACLECLRLMAARPRFRSVFAAALAFFVLVGGAPGRAVGIAASNAEAEAGSRIVLFDTVTQVIHQLQDRKGGFVSRLAWLPSGNALVVAQQCDDCSSEIVLRRVRAFKQVSSRRIARGSQPDVSPNGRRVVFVGSHGGIFLVGIDGLGLRRLFRNDMFTEPRWSPDGRSIARTVNGRNGVKQIDVVGLDGRGRRQLTSGIRSSVNPAWSPDGKRIAFARQEADGRWRIYVMRRDGSQVRRVSNGQGSDTTPTWSPNGSQLAFVRSSLDASQVYVMRSNGADVRRLPVTGTVGEPAWSPRGSVIACVRRG